MQRARHRQVDVDHAVPVFEQGHRQQHRQLGGGWTVHFFTKGQLIQDELVVGLQTTTRVYLVLQLQAEFAPFNGITSVLASVGGERCQFQIGGLGIDVQRQRLHHRIDLASDVEQGGSRSTPLQRDGCHVAGVRTHRPQTSVQLGELRAVVRAYEAVGEIHRRIGHLHTTQHKTQWHAIGCFRRRCGIRSRGVCVGHLRNIRRGPRCCRAIGCWRSHVTQVKAALFRDDQTRYQPCEIGLPHLDVRLASRHQTQTHAVQQQTLPTDQRGAQRLVVLTGWVGPIQHVQIGYRELAIGLQFQARRFLSQVEICRQRQVGTPQIHRHSLRSVRGENMHRKTLSFNRTLGLQGLQIERGLTAEYGPVCQRACIAVAGTNTIVDTSIKLNPYRFLQTTVLPNNITQRKLQSTRLQFHHAFFGGCGIHPIKLTTLELKLRHLNLPRWLGRGGHFLCRTLFLCRRCAFLNQPILGVPHPPLVASQCRFGLTQNDVIQVDATRLAVSRYATERQRFECQERRPRNWRPCVLVEGDGRCQTQIRDGHLTLTDRPIDRGTAALKRGLSLDPDFGRHAGRQARLQNLVQVGGQWLQQQVLHFQTPIELGPQQAPIHSKAALQIMASTGVRIAVKAGHDTDIRRR